MINTGYKMNNKIKYAPLVIALALAGCGGSQSNKAPEFTSSTAFTLEEDTSFSGQLEATDDDSLSFTLASAASHGLFALNANGSFTYTPNADFAGQDTVTVTASDGNLNTDAVLTFTINNVNDAPVLVSQTVTVTTSTTTQGSLVFNDADGDVITVELVTATANGTLQLDSNTGQFTYEAETLSEINDSFEIAFTDNKISEAITATIELTPSYVTNEDKRNFYYSSHKSHLKQAEAIGSEINDDNYLNEVNAQLAVGYLIAGFTDKANSHFEKITTSHEKASAYLDAAAKLDELQQSDAAIEYRELAFTTYNQYIAEKGLENISSSDPSFYLTISDQYNSAGQTEHAQAILDTISLYANKVWTEDYNTTYARFVSAVKKTALASVEQYSTSHTEAVRNAGLAVIKTMADLAENIGSYTQPSGDYKGQSTERMRALYMSWAADYYLRLNDTESAKYYTNLSLSYYGVVGFDNSYSFSASPYAEATLATYTYPLEALTATIKALYDVELVNNPAYQLLTKQADKDDALEYSYAYEIANKLQAGQTLSDAVSNAKSYFMEGETTNAKSFYQTLTNASAQPGAAAILQTRGENELALEVTDYAQTILASPEYVLSVSEYYIMGKFGCGGLVQLALNLNSPEKAKLYATSCAAMLDEYFLENENNFSTNSSISALTYLIATYGFIENNEGISSLASKLDTQISLLSNKHEQAEKRLKVLGYLVRAGLLDTAVSWLETSLAIIDSEKENIDIEDYTALLESVFESALSNELLTTGTFEQYTLITALSRFQANNQQYTEVYTNTISALTTSIDKAKAYVLTQSDKVIQDNLETLVAMYAQLGDDESVNQLINLSVNAEADKLPLLTLHATLKAQRDDFSGQAIASIDTDHDGKPNFFLPNVTEQAILESGLTADDDADNDGILDENDITPIGE